MLDRDTELLLKKYWNEMLPLDRQEYRGKFLMSFKPMSAYHDYYLDMSLDRIINDSVFLEYIADAFKPMLLMKEIKMQSLGKYRHCNQYLDHEPDDAFQRRLEQIKEMQRP